MLRIVLPLYCVVISLVCIFGSGIALLFTLGVGYVWVAPLAVLLYGMGNLSLLIGAFVPTDRRIVRFSAYSTIAVAVAMLATSNAGGSTQSNLAVTLLWCGAAYLNWLAIRKIVDIHLSSR